jgi:hypothetical protein
MSTTRKHYTIEDIEDAKEDQRAELEIWCCDALRELRLLARAGLSKPKAASGSSHHMETLQALTNVSPRKDRMRHDAYRLRQGPAVISLRRVQGLFSARRASRCHRLEAARIRQSPARQARG